MSPSQQSPLKAEDLRADVLAGVNPFGGRPELQVTDPAFVDPIIADAIQHGGSRDDVVRSAQMTYGNKLREPDGLARLEKLLADRYEHPVMTKDGERVTIDVGVVAGKLQTLRGSQIELASSPFLDRGEWATAEIVKFLQLAMAKYPDAFEYDAVVLIPARSKAPEWKYAYDRHKGTLRISQKDWRAPVYVAKNIGSDLSGVTSLHSSALDAENVGRGPTGR